MTDKSYEELKRYKTAAILFSISGLVFIIVGIVSGKIAIFLTIGIALIFTSIVFRQYGNKLDDNKDGDS